MAHTALITGASSGIGKEFARIHAAKGGDLVLVARSAEKLAELASELETGGVKAHVIVEDLTTPGAPERVFENTEGAGIEVDVLINNAGVGGHGKFHERELARHTSMIELNITALTALTHLYVQGMVARNRGQILQVGSTAGLLPGPLQAVYYATKAYVQSFSQAIAEELSGTAVTCTALCPGAVDTGFVEAGDLEGAALFQKPGATPRSVAEIGYAAMEKGKLVVINDKSLGFMLNWVIPFMPRRTVLKTSRSSMEKS